MIILTVSSQSQPKDSTHMSAFMHDGTLFTVRNGALTFLLPSGSFQTHFLLNFHNSSCHHLWDFTHEDATKETQIVQVAISQAL